MTTMTRWHPSTTAQARSGGRRGWAGQRHAHGACALTPCRPAAPPRAPRPTRATPPALPLPSRPWPPSPCCWRRRVRTPPPTSPARFPARRPVACPPFAPPAQSMATSRRVGCTRARKGGPRCLLSTPMEVRGTAGVVRTGGAWGGRWRSPQPPSTGAVDEGARVLGVGSDLARCGRGRRLGVTRTPARPPPRLPPPPPPHPPACGKADDFVNVLITGLSGSLANTQCRQRAGAGVMAGAWGCVGAGGGAWQRRLAADGALGPVRARPPPLTLHVFPTASPSRAPRPAPRRPRFATAPSLAAPAPASRAAWCSPWAALAGPPTTQTPRRGRVVGWGWGGVRGGVGWDGGGVAVGWRARAGGQGAGRAGQGGGWRAAAPHAQPMPAPHRPPPPPPRACSTSWAWAASPAWAAFSST